MSKKENISYVTMMNFSSHPSNLVKVEQLAQQILMLYNVAEEKYPNLLISLSEAVSNAIIHGNKSDETKNVDIKIKQSNDGVAIRVIDEGKGFDLNKVPDPTIPENIGELGGRGIFLMKELTDDCVFLNDGSTVEMFFKI